MGTVSTTAALHCASQRSRSGNRPLLQVRPVPVKKTGISINIVQRIMDREVNTYRWQILAPAKQRRDADESRQHPDGGYHGNHVLHCTLDGVLKRASDDEIAVNTDGT